MRKLLCMLLAVAAVLSCVGCGEKDNDPVNKKETEVSKPAEKTVVSTMASADGEPYVEYLGEPYLMYGVQMRLDWIFADNPNDTAFIEDNFRQVKEDGFNSVMIPIHWNTIEPEKDKYEFDRLKLYYTYLNKYDLTVQWLWFGTNVCGFAVIPDYVAEDKDTYKQVTSDKADAGGNYMDFSCAATMQREQKALAAMMDWIAENDTEKRCVMIQLNNEVDQGAGYFQENFTDEKIVGGWWQSVEAHDKYCWVGGQRTQVFAQLSALGNIVHKSNYQVVTRVNVSGAGRDEVPELVKDFEEMLMLSGIDMVGVDCYSKTWDMLKSDVNIVKGNLTHVAENGGNYDSSYNTANLFDMGAGMLIYCHRDDREHFGMYEKSSNKEWKPLESTIPLRSFNAMLNKMEKPLAKAVAYRRFMAFNGEHLNGAVNIKKNYDGIKISFSGPADVLGAVYPITAKCFILMTTKDNTEFTFGDSVTVSEATFGSFDGNDWKAQNTAKRDGNKITVNAYQIVKVDFE